MKKIAAIIIFLFLGCAQRQREFSDTRLLMGTTFEIKVFANSGDVAKKSMDAAFDEIARLESVFSVHRQDTLISELNRNGSAKVPQDVAWLLGRSKYFADLSGGAFDITVFPLVLVWQNAAKNKQMPAASEIARARQLIDSKNIIIDKKKNTVSFAAKGVQIDLGGIAKGFAVDRAVELLGSCGIDTGMVNAGGNIRVFGDRVWHIALENPRKKGDYIAVLKLKNVSVATSGDYERYFFLDKKRISHIINPFTGYSADDSISATVIAGNATDADAMSTAVFVLGPQRGLELARRYGKAECLVIDKNRNISRSAGFSKYE
jgi:thiamine biosynthesis lipoprotein